MSWNWSYCCWACVSVVGLKVSAVRLKYSQYGCLSQQSDPSEGFNQIIDYLNESYIEYALTVNPTIYVSYIKQVWNTVTIKQSNDFTRLQALVDKKKVVVTEAAIRDALHLDDAEGVDCLPNEEIFTELARMGYEKPSTKLTFYKAFFSSQWKFFIHIILQSMSAKCTLWNEFSSTMASAVICLSTGDLSTHTTKYISLTLTQKVFSNMRRVGKGCSGVKTLLFEGMLVVREPEEQGDVEEQGNDNNAAEEPDTSVLEDDVKEALDTCAALSRRVDHMEHDKRVDNSDDTLMEDVSNQGRIIDELDKDEGAADIYQIDMDHAAKVLSMQEDEPKIQEVVEVVTTAKLITEVVAAVSEIVNAAVVVLAVTEESSAKTPTETKSKDKRKDWEVAIDHVKQKAKENPYVQRYQTMKKRPQTEAQALRNMMMYLKNTAGFRLDYFKGMPYDDIRLIFEAKFNSNIKFLLKTKDQIEEEENKAIASINETPAQKAAKRRMLNEEAEDVEELKQHLEIVPDKDDDVYTEATPLARK
nr:hypothetical protein [Tanacetum cinerariifolium]